MQTGASYQLPVDHRVSGTWHLAPGTLFTWHLFPLAQSDRSATIGSTRLARRAGRKHASIATPARTAVTTLNVSASVGPTPNSWLRRSRVAANEPSESDDDADGDDSHPFDDDHPNDLTRLGAERDANADFVRALRHGVAQHAVDADRAEQQRDDREPDGEPQR